MRFLPLACAVAVVVAGAAPPASAQTELNSTCFCQLGNDPKQFTAEVAVTDANRAALAKMMTAGDFALRKTVRVTGNGCAPAEWRRNRLCGSTSVTTTKPDGTRDSKSFDNTPVSGTKTLRITNTGNMPRKSGTPSGQFVLDEDRWAKVQVILVGGREE